MRRGLIVLVAAVALTVGAAPASGSWGAGEDLIPAGSHPGMWPIPVLTPNGDAMALWSEDDGAGDRWQLGIWPQGGVSTRQDFAPGAGTAAAIATGGGSAVAAYSGDASNDIHWRERPAGGTFGALQTLDLTGDEIASNHLAVAMNGNGDIAFVWAGKAIYAAVKPAGGSFSAPVKLGDGMFPQEFKAALSDSGELVAAWSDDSGIHAGRRSSSGQAGPEQILSGPAGTWVIDALAMDGAGHALLVWREVDGAVPTGKLALRGPGEDFAETTFPGPGLQNRVPSAAVMSGAGLVTLAYNAKNGVAVYSGQFGTPLPRVHTFGMVSGNLSLATSPGGRTVIAIDPDFYHRLTSQRDGTGAFGPLEDLQSDCRNQWTPALAIDDAGRTAAGWGGTPSTSSFLALGDAGAGHVGCAPSQTYSPDDAANPPPHGDPAGPGLWGPVPALPPGPLLHLALGQPTLTGSGATRTLKLTGTCGGDRCSAIGSALVLRPNGRVIQKALVLNLGDADKGTIVIRTPITLTPKVRAKLAGRPLEVEFKLRVLDEWSRVVARSFTLRGASVSAARARASRCARARCRRRA